MVSFRKVGGIRFLTIGKLTVSWSVAKSTTAKRRAARQARKELNRTRRELVKVTMADRYWSGYDAGLRASGNW